ncbi:hypothetical protein C0989_003039 [Termitomyces sp. Mn162]|nr:hypothetical protein C0989_003039 [Termitomyces sp. Mn162]
MEQDHIPGTAANTSVFTPEFAAILMQLTHNQTMLQNSLIDVMNEVAHCSSHHVPDQNPVIHGSHVKLRNAGIFSGKHGDVTPFLSEVKHIIQFHSISFPDDHAKVLYVSLHLHLKDGIPIEWFNHLEHANSPLLYDWNSFLLAFHKKFSYPSLVQNAELKLDVLKQTGSAHYYLTAYMELASHSKGTGSQAVPTLAQLSS